MIFLNAFILGGIMCLIFQIPLMYTKLGVFKLLGIAFILGAILTPFGVIDQLMQYASGGLNVMILAAGNVAYSIGSLAVAGIWPASLSVLVTLLGIVLFVFLCGVLGALAYLKMHKQPIMEAAKESDVEC
ncbi:SpoVA/SpoVAEb family sporulation membrane protein [Desulfitobacterium chlororespirans]|uniref:SpoVA protein n=1 Tax=Desulfitobacterium chlororespirans DSM 11544 TaxID=1121395 RepID=A0A1M7SJ85_9FIRM|nr:SpoVA/SpoVAEb family sporulation membrane protein [Desulfitobacterium chlororespirans]SHN58482.1 SpoVA protein [Desulfitobacterium chlororespirans DSM 11544]